MNNDPGMEVPGSPGDVDSLIISVIILKAKLQTAFGLKTTEQTGKLIYFSKTIRLVRELVLVDIRQK